MAPPDHSSQMGAPQECFPLQSEPLNPTNAQRETRLVLGLVTWGTEDSCLLCPSHILGVSGEGRRSGCASGGLTWPSRVAQRWVGEGLLGLSEAALDRGERQYILAVWKVAL